MKFADLKDETIFISFTGGRTSAFMTQWILEHYDRSKCVVVFANTGRENPRTLEFVHLCDTLLGFPTVWVEAVVHPGKKKGCTHKIVTFETAARRGEPFEAVIQKYGIPNVKYPHCTRELKLNAMHSYLRSIGLNPATVPTAIGIRVDEKRRVKNHPNVFYPLVDDVPMEKQDVLDWWDERFFDLDLEEFEGNCQGCFKKSYAKHFAQLDKDPSVYVWTDEMEKKYGQIGSTRGGRVFFRGSRSTEQLIQLRRSADGFDPDHHVAEGGCTESCERYETEDAA